MSCNCQQPLPDSYVDTTCIADRYRVTLVSIDESNNDLAFRYQICSCGTPAISHFSIQLCPQLQAPRRVEFNGRRVNFEVVEPDAPGNFFDFRNVKIDQSIPDGECRLATLIFSNLEMSDVSRIKIGIKAGQREDVGRITGPGECGFIPK